MDNLIISLLAFGLVVLLGLGVYLGLAFNTFFRKTVLENGNSSPEFKINIWIYDLNDSLNKHKLKVNEHESIRSVKNKIHEKYKIKFAKQNHLTMFGQILEDQKLLSDYNIHQGSIIDLVTN